MSIRTQLSNLIKGIFRKSPQDTTESEEIVTPDETKTPEPLALTTLPDREDMLERLKGVTDDPYMVEGLFFQITSLLAGRQVAGAGVVNMLQLAFGLFCEDKSPETFGLLQGDMDDYIKALVDDKQVRSDALAFMEEVRCWQQ
ncbi:MAG TPA: hypothetical protein VK497_05255 [Candidatus Saccharimonadales bacterium]|nr:hypothetical protein [Candidatus Saccharimonadales bacterium]